MKIESSLSEFNINLEKGGRRKKKHWQVVIYK